MVRCFVIVAVISCALNAVATAAPEAAPPESADLRRIFNGRDLAGWDGDPRLWSVKDGAIRGETTAENPARGNTFIIWKDGVTKDFELRLSFRCNATNNSGIQYRSKHITEGQRIRNNWVVRGYQHEIRNETKLPSVAGFIYDEGGRRGRTCLVGEQATWEEDGKKVTGTLIDEAGYQQLFKLDDWNDVVIIAEGTHIQHFLNGRLILDFTDHPRMALREGILAFQLHAGKPMFVEFKDVRFKELK